MLHTTLFGCPRTIGAVLAIAFVMRGGMANAQEETSRPPHCVPLEDGVPSEPSGRQEEYRVSVAVYDYANAAKEIPFAQRIAAEIYGKIGVGIDWTNGCDARTRPTLYLNVITNAMARRQAGIPSPAVGFAGRGTRGAYAVLGRTSSMAVSHRMTPAFLLGFVFAHEIAHLLLPPGTHSRNGLMSPDIALESARMKTLQFSAAERRLILERLATSETIAAR